MWFICNTLHYLLSTARLTLREVVNENEVREVTEWYQLGLQLGVPPPKLREVESDYPQNPKKGNRVPQFITQILGASR